MAAHLGFTQAQETVTALPASTGAGLYLGSGQGEHQMAAGKGRLSEAWQTEGQMRLSVEEGCQSEG